MKRSSRAALGLAAALLAALTAQPALAADRNTLQQNLTDAQNAYDEAQKQLENSQAQQDETEDQIDRLEGTAGQIRQQITTVYTQLQQAQLAWDTAQNEAENAAAALAAKQAEYDETMHRCKEQMQAMQRLQDGGGIAVLSQVKSLYQLLTVSHTMNELAGANSSTLEELDRQAGELETRRDEAQAAADAAQAARDSFAAQQAALEDTQAALADELMQANEALSRQQADAEALAAVTEEKLAELKRAQAELDAYNEAQSQKYTAANLYCGLEFGSPLGGGSSISCSFGSPDGIDGSPHNGTDFPKASGTPVYAVADGVVSVATTHWSYGNYVQISHGTDDNGNRYDSLYAHMSSYAVSAGQTVSRGQVIGYVGNTGAVAGANGGYHLHLELRVNGGRVNPMNYIPN